MDAHHITSRKKLPSGGYVKENGISLCATDHLKAEEYLQGLDCIMEDHQYASRETIMWMGEKYSPEALYESIGSSLALALEKSEALDDG